MTETEKRKTEAALLLIEASGRRRLRKAVSGIVGHYASRTPPKADATRVALYAAVDIATATDAIVEDLRAQATRAGIERMRAEVKAQDERRDKEAAAIAALLLLGGSKRPPLRLASTIGQNLGREYVKQVERTSVADMRAYEARRLKDAAKAQAEARAAANAEREAYANVASQGPYRSAGVILQDAEVKIQPRIDTIAASEPSQAMNKAREEFVEQLTRTNAGLLEEWSAVLDGRTCPLCASLHGMKVPAGSSFSGYRPGSVHARCRCMCFLVWPAHSARKAA